MLSLIIPVYKNEASLPDLLRVVASLNDQLNGEFEAVFVVDGSPDRCYEILRRALPACAFQAKLGLLSRNFGSFSAIRAGLELGEGQRFAVMAADLQEPPELILEMDEALRTDDFDVVIGVRQERQDPILSRLTSRIFWGLYRRVVLPQIPSGGVDVFACTNTFRNQLLELQERHSSLVALIFWLGYRRKSILYSRRKREYGRSAWSFGKKLNYLLDSVFSFTDLPLRLLTTMGGATALVSGMFAVLVVFFRLLGLITVPGYAATILAIIFFGALNMFGLGIVGSYAWRTYENTKQRPLHVMLACHTFARPDLVDTTVER